MSEAKGGHNVGEYFGSCTLVDVPAIEHYLAEDVLFRFVQFFGYLVGLAEYDTAIDNAQIIHIAPFVV